MEKEKRKRLLIVIIYEFEMRVSKVEACLNFLKMFEFIKAAQPVEHITDRVSRRIRKELKTGKLIRMKLNAPSSKLAIQIFYV